MPLFQEAGQANIFGSGSVSLLNFTGSAVASAVIDATGTLTVTMNGGSGGGVVNVYRTGTLIGAASTLDFSGTGISAINMVGSVAGITATAASGGPGGANLSVQYNDGASGFAGALSATIDASGNLNILETTGTNYPPNPAVGVTFFTRNRIGKNTFGATPASGGYDYTFQPHMSRQSISLWNPPGNATTAPAVFGIAAASTSGTATAASVAVTPFSATLRRIDYRGAAAAQNGGAWSAPAALWLRGGEPNVGGFHAVMRFVLNPVTAPNPKFFCGMRAGVTFPAGTSQPSATLDCAGIMKNPADSQYFFCWNDNTGLVSSASTGITYTSGAALEVQVFSPPSGTYVGISVQLLQSGTIATMIANTDLPTNTTLLAPLIWFNNDTSTARPALGVSSVYVESDN